MNKRRIALLLIIAVVVMGTILYAYPPLRLHLPFYPHLRLYAILLLRNPLCSFSQAFRGLSFDECNEEHTKLIYASCKLLKKDAEGFELWETTKGPLWAPADLGCFVIAGFSAEQDCKIYGTDEQGVQPGEIVLDCGAHIGIYTREALAAGAKLVVAIEPTPENVECLRRNFSKEIAAGRVIVYAKGVWHREETVLFKVGKFTGGNRIVEKAIEGKKIISIPVTTIDKIVAELKLPRVDFIKMDIEGAEQKALIGATETITKFHPRMAIGTEHTKDFVENARRVSEILRVFGHYCIDCRQCRVDKAGRIAPLTILVY